MSISGVSRKSLNLTVPRPVLYVQQAPPNTMRELTHTTPLCDLDFQATVGARPPLLRSIERPHGQGVREPLRCEDKV